MQHVYAYFDALHTAHISVFKTYRRKFWPRAKRPQKDQPTTTESPRENPSE